MAQHVNDTIIEFTAGKIYLLIHKIMNIYIGNLHYNVNEEELKEVFKEYGEVMSVTIITDKYTGRSKGFGFVEMLNDEEANRAIDNLNDTEIHGRKIKVNQARERGKE